MPSPKRLILVTGCSRSGTTAIGSNLALAGNTHYVYEPFNSQTGLTCIHDRFPVPGAGQFPIELLDECVEHIRTLNMNLKPGLLARDTGWRRVFKRYLGSRTRLSYLGCRLHVHLKTIIWKDPLAAFAAEAAAIRHEIPVVVTVRPPVAVAASFKRMDWTPPVAELDRRLSSTGLDGGEEYVLRYQEKLEQSSIAAAVLWRMVYSALLRALDKSPLVYFVNVQDFVDRPVERYHFLYDRLELPWSRGVKSRLAQRHKDSGNGSRKTEKMPQRAHIANRNLREINEYGRKLLAPEDIALVEEITGDMWPDVQASCLTW